MTDTPRAVPRPDRDVRPAGAAMRAVVLAAGRGSRMRRPDAAARIDPAQADAADRGLKPLIPFHGRPFLSYVLHELAEAGFTDVCMVVGPDDDAVRAAAAALPARRIRLDFAVQNSPRGAADAVLAARSVVGDEPFVVINGDNLHAAAVLARIRTTASPGLAGFDLQALIRQSGIPPARTADYPLITEREGWLVDLVEKPDAATLDRLADARVSMDCWRLDPSVFDACRDVGPSPRGEIELYDAVRLALRRGESFRVVPVRAPVLDLSQRSDIPAVQRALEGREPRP